MTESDDNEIENLRLANQQAAEYGLALLSAKNQLQVQYEELKHNYVVVRYELEESNTQNGLLRSEFDEINNQNASFKSELEESNNQNISLRSQLEELKNQLEKVQINKHEEILKGKTNEENLLNEKQIREEHLNNEIKVHQQELRSLKQEIENLSIENKNMFSSSQELYKNIQELDELNRKLKDDLKENKNQERLLVDDNTELVEQNILLQQQVEKLGKNLINCDKLNVENKQLQENIDQLQQMMQDLESLKTIAESHLMELHETLRDERKQKYIYKQLLDDYIQKESRRDLNSLRTKLGDTHVQSNEVYSNSCDEDDTEDDDASHMTSSISESDQQLSGSLFSEIHLNEIHKLEQECFQLSQTKSSLDNQLLTINEKIKILSHKIEHFTKKMFPDRILSSTSNSDDTNDLLLKSIEQIDENLNLMIKQYNDTQMIFMKTHDNLTNLSEELENIHSYMYISNDLSVPSNDTQSINSDQTNLFDILHEQIQQVKHSFDHIKQNNQLSLNNQSNDTNELQDQIIKSNSLLTTKHEQINTLRKLLKESKETAVLALANLKSTHENEKSSLIETISKLRSESKILKEQAATFSSTRAMLSARCEDYKIQLTESQRRMKADEEEKRTMKSLLQMVIQQKLVLTQKLERYENNNDRSQLSPNLSRRTNNFDMPQSLLSVASNQNTTNITPERGRFLSAPTRQTFSTNRN